MPGAPLLRVVAVTTLLICAAESPAAAQQGIVFCFSDDTETVVQRFEVRDGKFQLYVAGNDAPLERSSSVVKSIGIPCSTGPRFGIHGSNTIGERLMPILIESYAQKRQGGKPRVKFTAIQEQEIIIKIRNGGTSVIDLRALGSATSAKSLIEGKALIGMSSRRINAEETAAIKARFSADPQLPGNENVLALDALAVIVNNANPVKQLSKEQIVRIFAGQTTNWSEVGGANLPINVYRRDDKSGTTDTFKSLVMGSSRFGANAKAFESSETVSSSVAGDPGGIGFIGLPYINRNTALAIASACGISSSPSKFSIKTEEYSLARRLYLYAIGAPGDPVARDFLQFALSDDAQPVVQEAEFVDQTIDFQDDERQRKWASDIVANPEMGLAPGATVPRDTVRAFQQMIGGMRRTTLALRFEYARADLDTRAVQDIARIARFLSSPAVAGKPYVIAGFADSNAGWDHNFDLAGRRAKSVADELAKQGVTVPRNAILSFSFMAPVACNDNEGAAKNRRVEVWIGR